MRSIVTFLIRPIVLIGLAVLLIGCQATPATAPDHRPGNFRLGVVVVGTDRPDSPGQNSRYIVDSSSILRASFGAGSTLDTFPGFTRRLDHKQMNAIWLMAKDMLEHNNHITRIHAGQSQNMVGKRGGIIIEIHMDTRDAVFVFEKDDQQAAAIVDALAALAWVDTTPSTRP